MGEKISGQGIFIFENVPENTNKFSKKTERALKTTHNGVFETSGFVFYRQYFKYFIFLPIFYSKISIKIVQISHGTKH